jgi:acetoacetyl-CoA synthetase
MLGPMPQDEEVSAPVREGDLLWEPGPDELKHSRIARYLGWLATERGLDFGGYEELWRWSVEQPGAFWESMWDFFDVPGRRGDGPALAGGPMPDVRWFAGSTVNYARAALRTCESNPAATALIFRSEAGHRATFSYAELAAEVARVQAGLRALGVTRGDRVAAFVPNSPHALIAMLAATALGAIWSSCSPDFGAASVIDRFAQIEPKVLVAVDGYSYGGKEFSRTEVARDIAAALPSLRAVITIDYLRDTGGTGRGDGGSGAGGDADGGGGGDAASGAGGGADGGGGGDAASGAGGGADGGGGGTGLGALPPVGAAAGAGPAAPILIGWNEITPHNGRAVGSPGPRDARGGFGYADIEFADLPFEHPLWVLYSSGTTGLPKPIVHGHGGVLLEHLKAIGLHQDLGPGDVFFWYTTTGWMMWNYLAGGLLVGAAIVAYDGSATYPAMDALWRLAAQTGVTYLGTGAPYLLACAKAGLRPGTELDLSALRAIGSTGSPLPPEGFEWVYEQVKRNLVLGSFSGGTDLCTGFVGPCPLLPVRAGVISGRCLGARVEAYDQDGKPLKGEVGELVITAPMPSMPVGFWNDPDGTRYAGSYFAMYPGVWRHGDWIKILPDGGCVIYGRSDATLNRGGVRMGTSEFYRVVERFSEVADSLVVDTGQLGKEGKLILYLVAAEGCELDVDVISRIRGALRAGLSPRHVPDEIHEVPGIPRTLSGKKLEVPVRKILLGTPVERAADPDALANPEVLRYFKAEPEAG